MGVRVEISGKDTEMTGAGKPVGYRRSSQSSINLLTVKTVYTVQLIRCGVLTGVQLGYTDT